MADTKNIKAIISGGGSGGHIFPALAIAQALENIVPGIELLFVGAEGKMEMEKIPQAGYRIEGVWITGLQRKLTWSNLLFPVRLLSSLFKSRKIISRFQPDVVIGTGGFASGPILEVATRMNIPTLIQEQNAYAGLTNKLLAKKVDKICIAYPGMEKYFPAEKLVMTGNPVRKDLLNSTMDAATAKQKLGLAKDKPTIVIVGGSLGAKRFNETMAANTATLQAAGHIQFLWQCGKLYYEKYKDCATAQLPNVDIRAFLDGMETTYVAADVMISRAGASTISELCQMGKAVVLVPSPNVSEDHQTNNAMALVQEKAAVLVPDAEAIEKLLPAAIELLQQDEKRKELEKNAKKLALSNAAEDIAKEVLQLIDKKTAQ